jgi:hypothetical protein
VLLTKLAELVGINDISLESTRLYRPAFQPTAVDPFLHIFGANMQSFSQGAFCEPVLPHPGSRPQPLQHGTH